MYKEEIIIPFIAITLVCTIFLVVPKLAWIFLCFKLLILLYLKIKNKRELFGLKFRHLNQTLKYIISLILIYFLNVFIFSNFVGDSILWYYTATVMIYIVSATTLTTKFGEKLEEKCILCHRFVLLEYMSFPIILLNIIIVFAMYLTALYDAVEKYGIIMVFLSSMLLSPVISLCWMFKNKIDPKLSIPWVLFIVLTIIHYYVFTKGVF